MSPESFRARANVSMAYDSMHTLVSESTHELIETGTDLLKPVNSNPTNSAIQNPFVLARAARSGQPNESNQATGTRQDH